MGAEMNELTDQKEFEERADYCALEDLIKWNVDNEHFQVNKDGLIRGTSLNSKTT